MLGMIETFLALALLGGLVGGAALFALVPWEMLFGGGIILVGVGMLVGVPAGFMYHVVLYRTLRPRAPLPRWWLLHPFGLHDRLSSDEKRPVMFWARLGAAGFVVAMLGCVMFGVGAWRS
jgi:hypothetical protein